MRIILVSCCGPKAAQPRLAKDLYLSPLFKISRAWAEVRGYRWFILSAKLGVVAPDTTIAPYDVTLAKQSAFTRRIWRDDVAAQMAPFAHAEIIVLAGAGYCTWARAFKNVQPPLAGISGIGRRIAWLKADLADLKSPWQLPANQTPQVS